MSKIIDYFNNLANNNKLGHAFLIGNATFNDIEKELEEVILTHFFKEEEKITENSDIYIIEPEKSIIVKEQILELQKKIKTTSLEHQNKLYIIKESEKMNSYASNSLLKLLEEPEKNIYAILITSNIEKVLPTIKSRCQIIYFNESIIENISKEIDQENIEQVIEFIKLTEKYKEKSIVYNKVIIKDKEELKTQLKIIEKIYMDCINHINGNKIEYFINNQKLIKEVTNNNTTKSLIKKLNLLNQTLNNLEYNLNVSLVMDKYYIELGRC